MELCADELSLDNVTTSIHSCASDESCSRSVRQSVNNQNDPNTSTDADEFIVSDCEPTYQQADTKCPCVQKPEGRDAWVMAFAGMCVTFCVASEFASFGIYYVEYTELFGVSKGAVGWIKGIQTLSSALVSILAGSLIKTFDCRKIAVGAGFCLFFGMFLGSFSPNIYVSYLTHGMLLGVGMSVEMITVDVCTQQHFTRNKVLGAGITNFGFTLGGLISPIIASHMVQTYGLRGALFVHSAILLNVVPLGMLLKSPKSRQTERHPKVTQSSQLRKELFDFSLLKNPAVVCYLVAGMFTFYNVSTIMAHVAGRAMFYGVSRQNAAYLQSTSSIGSCSARILVTVLGNMKSVNKVLVYGIGVALMSLASILYGFFTSYGLFFITPVLCGFGMGMASTVSAVACVELFTLEHLPKFLGFFTLATLIGRALGAPVSGMIYDATSDYDIPFFLAGSLSMTGSAMIFYMAMTNRLRKRRLRQDEN